MGQNDHMQSQGDITLQSHIADRFARLRARYSQRELAEKLNVSVKTIGRWEREETPFPRYLEPALNEIAPSSKAATTSALSTVDLFAGIGGIRLGFESIDARCVFSSEWNDFSKKTYIENHGDSHPFVGDIVPYPTSDIPDHDVLLAGFPCQPFSIAGVSKKASLGRPHGFEDLTQGTLFFDVARIISEKRPSAFLLENVKNLLSHDGGNTFRVILATLRDELGYEVHYKVIDGANFTPQHRERIIIVGFARPTSFSWNDVEIPQNRPVLEAILHRTDGEEPNIEADGDRYFDHKTNSVQAKFTLTPRLWEYLQAYAKKHREAGNGFGFGLFDKQGVARTLSARYYKDGSEILISQGDKLRPRRLTPRECARLMGYSDSFKIPVSDTQAYRQFGNSVVVPVIEAVAKAMQPHIIAVKSNLELEALSKAS